jgi:phage/plasmid-like protein (TIGR03299 family)
MRYHVAGSLKEGAKIFLLGKIGSVDILPQDQVDKYILLVNTHDGSGSVRALFTAVRVVCENTVNVALREGKGQGLAVRHTGDIMAKIEQSKEIFGIAQRQFHQFEEFAKSTTRIQFDTKKLEDFTNAIIPSPKDPEVMKTTEARREKQRGKIIELFETGQGIEIPNVAGTGWAAFNAVTEYLNYHRPVRGKINQEEKRISQVMLDSPKILQRTTDFLIAA